MKNNRIEAKKCRTKKDVENILGLLAAFMQNNIAQQEERVAKLSRLAAVLQNTDAKKRAGDLIFKQERINQKLNRLGESLEVKAAKITGMLQNGTHEVSLEYYSPLLFYV